MDAAKSQQLRKHLLLAPLAKEQSRVLPGVTYSLSSELRQVRKIALTVFDRCHDSDFQDLMQPCSIRRLAARHNLVPSGLECSGHQLWSSTLRFTSCLSGRRHLVAEKKLQHVGRSVRPRGVSERPRPTASRPGVYASVDLPFFEDGTPCRITQYRTGVPASPGRPVAATVSQWP